MINTLQVDTRFWVLYLKLMKYVKLSTFSSFIFVGEVSLVSSPIFTEVGNFVPLKLGDSKFDFSSFIGCSQVLNLSCSKFLGLDIVEIFLRLKRLWCCKKVLLLCGGLLVYLQPSKFSFVGNRIDAAKCSVSCLLEILNYQPTGYQPLNFKRSSIILLDIRIKKMNAQKGQHRTCPYSHPGVPVHHFFRVPYMKFVHDFPTWRTRV